MAYKEEKSFSRKVTRKLDSEGTARYGAGGGGSYYDYYRSDANGGGPYITYPRSEQGSRMNGFSKSAGGGAAHEASFERKSAHDSGFAGSRSGSRAYEERSGFEERSKRGYDSSTFDGRAAGAGAREYDSATWGGRSGRAGGYESGTWGGREQYDAAGVR